LKRFGCIVVLRGHDWRQTMSALDYDMDSFDIHTFDPCHRPRRIVRPAAAAAARAAPAAAAKAQKAKPVEAARAPDPGLAEALLAEVAARRQGMMELERRVEQVSLDLRRVRTDQEGPTVAIRFTPAAGFGKPTL
jgi:hypothetical protein